MRIGSMQGMQPVGWRQARSRRKMVGQKGCQGCEGNLFKRRWTGTDLMYISCCCVQVSFDFRHLHCYNVHPIIAVSRTMSAKELSELQ